MTILEEARRAMKKKRKSSKPVPVEDYLSTGSSELNLACTGNVEGGFAKGFYYLVVGDSTSGKTALSLTCLAEAAINPRFKDYALVYDDVENGNLFNMKKFWPALYNRIQPPRGTRKNPEVSSTVEEMYDNLNDAMDRGPCIYIVDSMDSLVSDPEVELESKNRKARQKRRETGKGETKGSYGMTKQKTNSGMLRVIVQRLRKTKSILVIIAQTRDAINTFGWGETKTRGGGHSLKFYATLELWSSVYKRITKTVREKDREIGIVSLVKVKKNRIQGKNRKVYVPIYHSHGIDDTGGMVNYLIEEGHWKGTANTVKAPEWKFSGKKESLIHMIEEKDDVHELKMLVQKVWNEIEESCTIIRKNKYQV